MSTRDRNAYEIYVMNDDGTGVTRLTDSNAMDSAPSFSPDGSRIVFAYTPDPTIESEIYAMNADGSGIIRLTNNLVRDAFPAFSPDGTTVAFERNMPGGKTICTVSVTGGSEVIGIDTGQQPHFSPDGSKIVHSRVNDYTGYMDMCIAAYTPGQVLPEGTQLTSGEGNDLYPVFSPDGSRIAFVIEMNGSREIYVMNADGTGQTRLTNSSGHSYGPLSFSPDGARIAFTSDRDGNEEIYVMNSDGTNQTRLTRNAVADIAPSYGATVN